MAWTTPGTATAGEVLTAAFWNANVRDNSNEIAPFFSGWTNFNPTLTGGFAIGNATYIAKYLKVGRLVHVICEITTGSTTSYGSFLGINVPITAAYSNALEGGDCWVQDTSAGVRNMCTFISQGTTRTDMNLVRTDGVDATTRSISATVPFTWATGDRIFYRLTYEAAS